MKSVEILSIVAISLFILLGLFLISNSKSWKKGFGWLGIFFLLLAVNYLDGMLILNGFILKVPRLAFWEDPFALLYGPLIYLFSLRLRNGVAPLKGSTLLHFIPFVLMEVIVVIYHSTHTVEQVRELLSIIMTENHNLNILLGIIPFFGHVIVYILLAQRNIQKHQSDLKQYYSSVEIRWVFSLIRMILIIFLISLVSTAVQHLATRNFFSIALMLLVLMSILLTARILLYALNQPIFLTATTSESTVKLSKAALEQLKSQINSLFTEKKLFSDPKLTLKDLSQHLGVSERVVSFVINHAMAENFYDLVNNYRIEEAQKIFMTSKDNKLTVLEVLYQVGFNSKSSFNTQFRKKTGFSPSEFRRQLNKN